MGQITNGISKIEVAPTGPNGIPGTDFETLGYTSIDSASVQEADGTTNDFNVEELDDALYSRTTKGKTTIAFTVADPNLATFQKVFGGVINGSGDAAVWSAPKVRPNQEWTVRITPDVGYVILFPRTKLNPKMNLSLGKNNLATVPISLDMLTPQDANTPPVSIGGIVGNTGTPGQAQTITFGALGSKSIATDSPVTLTATSSSGLPITYQSDDPAKATVNGNQLTLLAAGTCNIIATQPGNATYAAAPPVVNELTITA